MLGNIFNSSILTMGIIDWEEVGQAILSMFYKIMLTLDAIVFYTIDLCYQVFLALSRARVFSEGFFDDFINRFYVLIGVLMMFFIVYTLLKVIVNPDDMTKGNMAPGKIVTNTLTSIVLVALLPTIFNMVYKVQGVLLDNDIIGRIVIGGSSAENIQEKVKKGGREIAVQVFSAFFYPNSDAEEPKTEETIVAESGHQLTLAEAKQQFIDEDVTFWVFCDFSANASKGEIHYSWLISTIAGGFCLYVMLCFVFDVGIRAVKLGVLQIIAPIPVLMRILPGKDKTFSSWVSLTASTFFEIFIRIFLIYIIAVFAGQLPEIMDTMDGSLGVTGPVKMLAQAFLLMGIIAFAKQAPKMLSDLLGIKTGNMGLSLNQRMTAGGGFVGAAAIGGGAKTFGNNMTNAYRKRMDNYREKGQTGVWAGAKSIAGSLPSAFAGAAAGTIYGGAYGTKSKTFTDMANAAKRGNTKAVKNRQKREQFYSDNDEIRTKATEGVQNVLNKVPGSGTAVGKAVTGAIAGAAGGVSAFAVGHGKEIRDDFLTWWTGDGVETLRARKKLHDEVKSTMDAPNDKIKQEIKDHPNEYVYRYTDANGVEHAISYASILEDAKNKHTIADNFNFKESAEGIACSKKIELASEDVLTVEKKLSLNPSDVQLQKAVSDAKIVLNQAQNEYKVAEANAASIKAELSVDARNADVFAEDALKDILDKQISYQMTGKKEYLVKFDKNDLANSLSNKSTGEINLVDLLNTYEENADGVVVNRKTGVVGTTVDGEQFIYDDKLVSSRVAEADDMFDQMRASFKKNSAVISRNIQNYVGQIQEEKDKAQTAGNDAMVREYQTQIDNLNALMHSIQNPSKWDEFRDANGNIMKVKYKDRLKAFNNMNASIAYELAKKEKEEQEKKDK